MILSQPLVVMDLETTGTWIEKDKIVEIALLRMEVDGSRKTYLKRVNPGISIPPVVSRLIGISDEDVQSEPSFGSIAQEVFAFIGESDFGGFNVERFDLPLLEREFFESGIIFEWKKRAVYDAQKIYRFHEKRDLTAAFKFYCQKELKNAHTALADSEAAFEILAAQLERYGEGNPKLERLLDFSEERPGDFYDAQRKFRWWNRELYPLFGKYARRYNIKQLAEKKPDYLRWILSADFDPDVKALVRDALEGRFPQYRPLDVPQENIRS